MDYKEVWLGLPEEKLQKYATGIGLVHDFVDSLRSKGLLPERFVETPEVKSEVTIRLAAEQRQNQDFLKLQQAIAEYKKGPLTPELVTNYWRAKLQVDGARVGIVVEVPDCDWTKEEIKRPMADIKGNRVHRVPGMMVYKPEQFKGKED